ncbi:hypothetical protein [Mesorhizobium sp. AR07]|uniref:hypothetical protein n=1 Tax=Mesorhizobium sp. AR07 TaxID=2865838 RepID=UPI00215F9F95|nr:hypothetical protein [Mesorhizobium sp. AR07]
MPAGVAAPAMANSGRAPSLPGRLWRIASALPAQLLGKRRLPPENDHLRHDIGLPERKTRRDWRDYDRWDR